MYLPLLLFLIEKFIASDRIIYLILFTLIYSIIWLSNVPSIAVKVGIFVFIYFLFRTPKSIKSVRLSFYLILSYILTISIASIIIFPTYELFSHSIYSGGKIESTEGNSFSFAETIYFFWPINPAFINTFSWFLILFAVILLKNSIIKSFLYISLIAFILATGKHGYFYEIFPSFPTFLFQDNPKDFIPFLIIIFSIISGFGADFIFKENKKRELIFLTIKIFFSLIIFSYILFSIKFASTEEVYHFEDWYKQAIYWKENRIWTFWILLFVNSLFLIIFLNNKKTFFKFLFVFMIFINLSLSWETKIRDRVSLRLEDNLIMQYLKKDKDIFRIYDTRQNKELSDRLPILNSTQKFPLKFYNEYFEIMNRNVINFANVKYIISEKKIENNLELLYKVKNLRIYKNKLYYPRFFVVNNFQIINNKEEIFARLQSEEFDLRNDLILEESPKVEDLEIKSKDISNEEVRMIKYSPQEIVINAYLKNEGFLILSDAYYPGWKAYINGKETEIYKGNYFFRAVYLPSGKNIVKFTYKPDSFYLGFKISLISILLLLIIWYYKRIKSD